MKTHKLLAATLLAFFACLAFPANADGVAGDKSSLIRAGVSASLTRYNLDEVVREWRRVVLVPGIAAGDLPAALVRLLGEIQVSKQAE